jgi:predicted nucleic acid-binding protein
VDTLLALLADLRAQPGWQFWPCDVSLTEIVVDGATVTHSQITDLYLLGLAARKGGKLATLDSRINAGAVAGGREALYVIPSQPS